MARKKPARPAKKAVKKAKKKAAPKAVARKAVKKTARKAARKPAKKAAKPAKKAPKGAKRHAAPIKAAATKKAKAIVKTAKRSAAGVKAAATKIKAKAVNAVTKATAPAKKAPVAVTKTPNLDRPRKTVADIHGIPSSLGMASMASAAHSGGEEMRDTMRKNNSASPALTAGDVDADWQSAESQGDESPGGDNPTPDQDVVDEIGRALGVEYADDEELQGGAEIAERDTHRWELDPNSKDDFDEQD